MAAKKKPGGADDVLAALRKRFGQESAIRLSEGGSLSEVTEAIPTGLAALDEWVVGVGGFPVGRIVEVIGEEGSGKTSLALAATAGAHRAGGIVVYSDNEHTLLLERVRTFGGDPDRFILLQPQHLEETLDQMRHALESIPEGVGPNLLVWDSLAATPPKSELVGESFEKSRVAEQARILSRAWSVLVPLLSRKRVATLVVNQVREKIGVMFGDNVTSPGGHSTKHHASVRLHLTTGKAVKEDDVHVGKAVWIDAKKNKLVVPRRKIEARLLYASGWDEEWTTLTHAKKVGLVPPRVQLPYQEVLPICRAAGWMGNVSLVKGAEEAGDG